MNRFTSPIIKLTVLVAALAAVAAGTATAAKLITGKQVKDRSLTGRDIKKKTLGVKHLTPKARTALKGATGATGEAGPAGAQGPQGERGPSTVYAKHVGTVIPLTPVANTVLKLEVPNGSYVVQAKTVLSNNNATGGTPECQLGVVRGDLFEALDDGGAQKVGPVGSDSATRGYALLAVATVDNGTNTVELRCSPDDGQSLFHQNSTLTATQVAEIK